jgi:anti-sigma regulatory factor (Ser/Thr protein kinase)
VTTEAVETPVVLRVPADPSFAATVRIFGGAIGRRAELEDERVDDLKLALSEIVAELIGDGHGTDVPLRFEIASDERNLRVRCRGPLAGPGDEDDSIADHRRRLLEAIAPDALWSREGDERVVTFNVAR